MSGIKKELLLREIEGKLDVLEMYEQIKSMPMIFIIKRSRPFTE